MNLSPYLCASNGRALVPTFSGLIHKFKPKHELVVIRLEILQGKLNRCHHIHITNPPTSVHFLHLRRWGQRILPLRGEIRTLIVRLIMFVASLQWLQTGSFCWKMWMNESTFCKHLRMGALTANFPNTMHFLSIVNVCYVHTATGGLAHVDVQA